MTVPVVFTDFSIIKANLPGPCWSGSVSVDADITLTGIYAGACSYGVPRRIGRFQHKGADDKPTYRELHPCELAYWANNNADIAAALVSDLPAKDL